MKWFEVINSLQSMTYDSSDDVGTFSVSLRIWVDLACVTIAHGVECLFQACKIFSHLDVDLSIRLIWPSIGYQSIIH